MYSKTFEIFYYAIFKKLISNVWNDLESRDEMACSDQSILI